MSIRLVTVNQGEELAHVSNGTWDYLVKLVRTYEPDVAEWEGTHDGEMWCPAELEKMQAVLRGWVDILQEGKLAGGVRVE